MSKTVLIRGMTLADLKAANLLREAVGWNQLPHDWERLLAHDPTGCFVADWNGQTVGTATTTSYGAELAWIGMVLVHPEHRRRGIGKALLQHCLDHLDRQKVRSVKLDATPLGKTLYDQLGFKDEWTLARWEGGRLSQPASRKDQSPRPWTDGDLRWIEELDSNAFGVSRQRMLQMLVQQSACALVHPSAGGRGYGLLRPGSHAFYIGPVVSDSERVGLALVEALLEAAPDRPIFWDIPDSNTAAVAFAQERGFKKQRPLIRMFRGSNETPGNPGLCFAIADPSIG